MQTSTVFFFTSKVCHYSFIKEKEYKNKLLKNKSKQQLLHFMCCIMHMWIVRSKKLGQRTWTRSVLHILIYRCCSSFKYRQMRLNGPLYVGMFVSAVWVCYCHIVFRSLLPTYASCLSCQILLTCSKCVHTYECGCANANDCFHGCAYAYIVCLFVVVCVCDCVSAKVTVHNFGHVLACISIRVCSVCMCAVSILWQIKHRGNPAEPKQANC